MSISKAALKLAASAAQDRKNRGRCQARPKKPGVVCGRPVRRGWPHCGRAECAAWVFVKDAA